MREFPYARVPTEPGIKMGREYNFRIGYGMNVPTALEVGLEAIEAKLKDALADEEKAVPFYQGLQNDIKQARELNPIHMPPIHIEREIDRYLYSMQSGIGDIGTQEAGHKARIGNMLKAIQELRRTLELERTTGNQQVLRPLERVGITIPRGTIHLSPRRAEGSLPLDPKN